MAATDLTSLGGQEDVLAGKPNTRFEDHGTLEERDYHPHHYRKNWGADEGNEGSERPRGNCERKSEHYPERTGKQRLHAVTSTEIVVRI